MKVKYVAIELLYIGSGSAGIKLVKLILFLFNCLISSALGGFFTVTITVFPLHRDILIHKNKANNLVFLPFSKNNGLQNIYYVQH